MRFRFALLALPIAAAALAFSACNGESEGMPCDINAGNHGNDDCQSPLVCTTGLANAQGARCCPPDRATATTPECSLTSATGDASPAPPVDSSSSSGGDATTSDAAGDGPAADGTGGDGGGEAAPAEAAAGDGPTGTDGPTE